MVGHRNLGWRSPITIALCAACAIFLLLGLRTLLLPEAAAAFYGVPVSEPDGLVFVRAYGARNIGISLLAITLIWLDFRKAVASLLAAAALIAALDAGIMLGHSGWPGAAKHVAYVVVLGGLALATARRQGEPARPG